MIRSTSEASQVPHFHYSDEIMMDRLIALRTTLQGHKALQVRVEAAGRTWS
jgi:hypothetical protein